MKTVINSSALDRSVASVSRKVPCSGTLQRMIDSGSRMTTMLHTVAQFKSKVAATNQLLHQNNRVGPVQNDVIQCMNRVSYFSSSKARFARRERILRAIGGRNLATARIDVNGVKRHITKVSKGHHSEALIKRKYDQLVAKHGAGNVDMRWLYSELKPCGSDYHNCRDRVAAWFPGVPVYYSLDYTKHRHGVNVATAKRRRRRSSAMLRRFNTRLRQIHNGTAVAPVDASSFTPSLRRVNSDPNLSKGYSL